MATRFGDRAQLALAVAGFALFGVVATTASIPSCGGRAESSNSVDASAESASTEPDQDATSFDDVIVFPPPDAFVPTHGDAGPPPVVACGPDAGPTNDGPECALPPSTCLDTQWLVAYANGRCVDGLCVWDDVYVDCAQSGGSRCMVRFDDAGVCYQVVGK